MRTFSYVPLPEPLPPEPPVIQIEEFNAQSTGDEEADSAIDAAVEETLRRLKPTLRTILREELKRVLELGDA